MSPPGVDAVALASAIRDRDPDVLSRDELAARVHDVAALRAWCDAEQVRNTRAQRRLAEQGRAESPTEALATEGRQSGRDARATDERERVCTAMPGFEDALGSGVVSSGHVDAVAASTRGMSDTERAEFASHADGLVADAANLSVDEFERACRDLARLIRNTSDASSDADRLGRQRRLSKVSRWTDSETGMRNTLISCDPERDAALWAAIDAARRGLVRSGHGDPDWQQLQVDAVVHAVTGRAGVAGAVIMLIDHETLLGGLHERSVSELSDGTPMPVDTVRRMACDAGIIPVVLDSAGRALDVGRQQRLATEAQRQALLSMYCTCGFPGCGVPVEWCEIHHVEPWEDGGSTDLANLLPLCLAQGHHHLVHEGGWSLAIDADRMVTVRRPDGTVWFEGSTIDRAPAGVGTTGGFVLTT